MKNRLNDDIALWHWARARQARGGQSWSSYWATREPSALVLTVVSDVRIDATWTDSAVLGADGYKVYISTDNATWTLKDTVAVGLQASSITGLTQATIYYIKVVAYKGTNESTGISDFQLTLASILMQADAMWFDSSDLSNITKDANDYVSAFEDRLGSGEILAPRDAAKLPKWESGHIRFPATGGAPTAPNLLKAFTLNQPCEFYLNVYLPNYIANTGFFASISADQGGCYFRYSAATAGAVTATTALESSAQAISANTWHILYLKSITTFNASVIGVDDTEASFNGGTANCGGISLGSRANGYGLSNSRFRDVVVRKSISSDTDKVAMRRYLTLKNAFFLT